MPSYSPPVPFKCHSLLYSLQLVRTVVRLGQAVAVPQIGSHFEGVYLYVGLLSQGCQFPQQHPEHPLQEGIWRQVTDEIEI